MDNIDVKIGRLSKGMEDCLSIHIPGDVFVYIRNKKLNELAITHPSDYLRRMEVVRDILSRPHYCGYEKDTNTIFLFRTYYKNDAFVTYCLSISKAECLEYLDLFKTKEHDNGLETVTIREMDFKKKKKA